MGSLHGVRKAGSWGPGHPQRFLKKFYNGRAPTKFWQDPCKILTSWYACYDGMTYSYMYKYNVSISACACIDFSLLFLNPYEYIVKWKTNVCTTVLYSVHTYVVIVNGIQEGTHKRFSRTHPLRVGVCHPAICIRLFNITVSSKCILLT